MNSKKAATSHNTIFTHRAFALGLAGVKSGLREAVSVGGEEESAGHIRTD
ncbi:hypothetical protein P4H66_00875 [Paenibacillus dokdonensis]|uniref:Uncharacterized protein n=1 Tax=Paenibacillus dokdonensis TaxID=2567944 RepID=A0ABU6GFC2_9BACL|nr:hypothetical protein [Paenibacillus dokdonensis]MEC0238425.1 hypothetical protein [Paenibacillus dokdonensis]